MVTNLAEYNPHLDLDVINSPYQSLQQLGLACGGYNISTPEDSNWYSDNMIWGTTSNTLTGGDYLGWMYDFGPRPQNMEASENWGDNPSESITDFLYFQFHKWFYGWIQNLESNNTPGG